MKRARSTVPVLVAAALAAGATGCGGSGDKTTAAQTPSVTTQATGVPGPIVVPNTPTATFIFDGDALKPPVLRMPRVSAVRLVVVSADGRPHAVVVNVGGRRQRLVIGPSERATLQLHGLHPGRYRVVPDGATEPVTLRIG